MVCHKNSEWEIKFDMDVDFSNYVSTMTSFTHAKSEEEEVFTSLSLSLLVHSSCSYVSHKKFLSFEGCGG